MEISEVNPDGNVYQLKDATARSEITQIKAQNIYSGEETDTGKKWIDGKTIYRRAYNLGDVINGKDLTIPEIDKVINMSGVAKYDSSQNLWAPIPGVTVANFVVFSYITNGIRVRSTSTSATIYSVLLTVEYTKQ